MNQDPAASTIDFKDDAPRSDAAPEQPLMLAPQCNDIAGEWVC